MIPAWTPGVDDVVFPGLVLRDGESTGYRLDTAHPDQSLSPGYNTRAIEQGMSARWTVGFQVPSERIADLTLVALEGGFAVAEWSLSDDTATVALAMPDLPTVSINETIEYGAGVRVTPRATGAMVCGDPDIEPIAHLFTVTFDVRNDSDSQVRWPTDIYSGPAPTAQWVDGASAAMSLETFWGDEETLPRVSGHAVLVPPATTAPRALVFAAPRDGRVANLSQTPEGVRLPTANGDVWLDLSAVTPTVGLDPAMCDLGGLGAPIPYAFGPGPKFDVGGEDAVLSRTDQDNAADALLTTAVAAVALYFDANDRTLATFDEEKFLAVAPTLDIIEINAGVSTPIGTEGTVYFDTDPKRPAFLFVATRSASGTWLCTGGDLFTVPNAAEGSTLDEVGNSCFQSAFREDDV